MSSFQTEFYPWFLDSKYNFVIFPVYIFLRNVVCLIYDLLIHSFAALFDPFT